MMGQMGAQDWQYARGDLFVKKQLHADFNASFEQLLESLDAFYPSVATADPTGETDPYARSRESAVYGERQAWDFKRLGLSRRLGKSLAPDMYEWKKHLMQYKDRIEVLEERVEELQISCNSLQRDLRQWTEASINELRGFGFQDIADRLSNLCQTAMKEGATLVPGSLQHFVLFVSREHPLLIPEIGLNLDGCVQVVWQVPSYGSLAMNFLTSGNVEFSILYQHDPEERISHSGVSFVSSVMDDIGEFADKLRNA